MPRDDQGPTGRLLALLALLQSRPRWPGPELAARLEVTPRTVRRDVERLRRLGYPVAADVGVAGGYRLGAGGRAMPPLMLDRDEALAVAVCLRSTATDSIQGGGEAAIRALGKLEQLLPSTLRRQVGTISAMTARLGSGSSPVDPEVLVTLTRACRDGERLRARYRDGHGRETARRLDPHRLVSTARRWYLVARDVDRSAWRTLRVDRLLAVEATGHRVVIEDPPDPVAFVQAAISTTAYRHQARVELAASLAAVAPLVPPSTGILEAVGDDRTMLTTGGDDLDLIVFHLLALGVDFVVHEPPALRDHLARVTRRLAAAVR
jgi:predicted DNA-binding transcriptional regulator YafY